MAKEEKTLSEQDRQRIRASAELYTKNTITALNDSETIAMWEGYVFGAEYEHKYQREQQAELIGKLRERLERCRKVSGYTSGFSDIHNEIDFLDLLLNSLKK